MNRIKDECISEGEVLLQNKIHFKFGFTRVIIKVKLLVLRTSAAVRSMAVVNNDGRVTSLFN